MQTVILCGGRGMRLREYTEAIPKVLVEVGGRPILWHIMKGYAHYNYTDFVLALGYLGDRIKGYFLDYLGWKGRDLRLRLGSNQSPELLGADGEDWTITFVRHRPRHQHRRPHQARASVYSGRRVLRHLR